jgi:hypothetical protein
MFSLVLKNSILMILLILIIHFMIINYLCDLQRMNKKKDDIVNNRISKSLDTKSLDTTSLTVDNHTTVKEVNEEVKEEVPIDSKESLQDLYDFVYNDDKDDEEDIDKFFIDESKPCKIPSELTVPCDSQPNDKEVLFCKNEIDEFYEKNKKTILEPNQKDESTLNGNPIMYQYEQDKDTNLQGFEGFSAGFMSIKN